MSQRQPPERTYVNEQNQVATEVKLRTLFLYLCLSHGRGPVVNCQQSQGMTHFPQLFSSLSAGLS